MATNKQKGNVISFPRLSERHRSLGQEARRRQNFNLAKDHLEQALRMEPNHSETALDLMTTYHDLGLYEEAAILAEKAIRQDQGEFVDVLRIYIISLIQLERYEQVCETLSEILAEHLFPSSVYLEFSEVYRVCESFLNAQSFPLDDEEQSIAEIIADNTYHQDPTFSSFALQLWFEFLRAARPAREQIEQGEDWAAAIHFATELTMGFTPITREIAALYGVTTDALDARYQTIQRMLSGGGD